VADKLRENRFAGRLCSELALDPTSLVDRESPDFELTLDDGTLVGLEIEETIDQSAASGRASMERFCRALENELIKRKLSLFVVPSFSWDAANLIAPPVVREGHVRAVADLIERHCLAGTRQELDDIDQESLSALGAPFICGLTVQSAAATAVGWGHHRPGPNWAFVDDMIRHKDRLVPKYRNNMARAGAFWLLLVAGSTPAGVVWGAVARDHRYQTQFDRVFFMDANGGSPFELMIEART
jgi:hypothetical protein